MRQLWADRNCPGTISGFTPEVTSGNRGQEIDMFLNRFEGMIESFVIIDDNIHDFTNDQLLHTVKTTWENGLTSEAADEAIQLLSLEKPLKMAQNGQ